MSLILASLSHDAELTDELYVSLTEAMVKRLRDKTPASRVEAARALARLQVPRFVSAMSSRLSLTHRARTVAW